MPSIAGLRSGLRVVRRRVLARRRLLAALLAGLAVVSGLRATSAPPPPTVAVTVAARDLPAGDRLGPSDTTVADLPPDAVPDDVVADPAGRLLASPLTRGEPVTAPRLLGPGLSKAHPGLTAMPVRFPDAAAVGLLRVGDRIDVLATDPQGGSPSRILTDNALVLAVPAGSRGVSSEGLPGRLVVLGTTSDSVATVSAAGVTHYLGFAFSN